VQELIRGQFDDIAFEPRTDVDLEACLRMEADKTAALLACAASIGARALAAPPALISVLHGTGSSSGWRSSWWTTCSASGASRR